MMNTFNMRSLYLNYFLKGHKILFLYDHILWFSCATLLLSSLSHLTVISPFLNVSTWVMTGLIRTDLMVSPVSFIGAPCVLYFTFSCYFIYRPYLQYLTYNHNDFKHLPSGLRVTRT